MNSKMNINRLKAKYQVFCSVKYLWRNYLNLVARIVIFVIFGLILIIYGRVFYI